MARWTSWNPAAGFFHNATRDSYYDDPFQGEQRLRDKAQTVRVPPRVKRYAHARRYHLPRVDASSEFAGVLLRRRTWRQFSKRPLPIDALSSLLGLTGGIHHWAEVDGQPDLPLKTSPSGGSRHPIEIYVWARRVAGLPAGLYHYACDRHQLELVRRQRSRVSAQRYLPTQFWYESAPAIVFFSAVYERYQWKYGDPRAYRATLIEVGHQCQTFCLAATSLGLAPFCAMALADSEMSPISGWMASPNRCSTRQASVCSRPAAPSAPCRRGCRRPAFASTIGSFGTTHDHSVRTRRLRSHAADRGLRRVERAHQQHDAGRALDAWRRHEQDRCTRSRRSRPRRLPDNNKRFRQPSASMLRLPSPLLRSW